MQITPLPQVGASTAADAARAPDPSVASSSASPAVAAAAAKPAVTVDLSEAARTALATAGGSPAVSLNSGLGAVSPLVLRAEHLAGVIADGSAATDAQKATALADLYQLRFQSSGYGKGANPDGWFSQSTQAQRDQINNAVDKSAFFKQAVSAASQFNAEGMAIARTGQPADGSQTPSARFSRLPAGQQVLVWAGGASQFSTLEQYSAFLAQQDARASAAVAAPNSPSPSAKDQAYGGGPTATAGSIVSLTA